MKRIHCLSILLFLLLMPGCGTIQNVPVAETAVPASPAIGYRQITQEEAKAIMDTESDFVILDVREQDEYNAGHIPGAILLPYLQTDALAPDLLPNKDQKILVYCRSGRRSKIAAESLAALGYTNVLEFGGIIDWQYEIVD